MTEPTPLGRPIAWTSRLAAALRAEGVPCTLHESLAACEALEQLDPTDALDVYFGLKAALTSAREHEPAYDRCFWAHWGGRRPAPEPHSEAARHPPDHGPNGDLRRGSDQPPRSAAPNVLERLRREAESDRPAGAPAAELVGASYSPAERLAVRAFDRLDESELRRVDRIFDRIRLRLATRRSRRYHPHRRRGRPDLRRSLRDTVAHDGELLRIARRRRKLERPRVVLLCDVSGSMERYSRFLLRFLLAAGRERDVESFVFATRLTRLTPWLSASGLDETLDLLGRRVRDWSGGTRIGECLDEFVREHGRSLLGRRTVVVILSDGLDRGDARRLESAMAAIRRKTRKVVWLNPLLASPRYEPSARGMRAALPHIDVFAPGHSLENLLELERHISLT